MIKNDIFQGMGASSGAEAGQLLAYYSVYALKTSTQLHMFARFAAGRRAFFREDRPYLLRNALRSSHSRSARCFASIMS
jgi:hypothetical protein